MSKIKRHFYTAASPECSLESRLFKPAAAFEVWTGVTGIAGDYLFPKEMTASAYEDYVRYTSAVFKYYEFPDHKVVKKSNPSARLMFKMKEDWTKLTELNPVLKKIAVKDDPLSLHEALHGAACLLNADDINLMVRQLQKTKDLYVAVHVGNRPEVQALRTEIDTMTNGDATDRPIGWVAAPKTLRKIRNQLAKRYK